MKNKLKVYFASPLFTDMERDYNKKAVDFLRNKMKDSLDIYLHKKTMQLMTGVDMQTHK